jgi:assimilatory nitrate reductase catalytic subunit
MFRKWTSPETTFAILKELSRGQPCDITGIDGYDALEELRGVQWPLPEGSAPLAPRSERRLFEDGHFFHADQRARFVFDEPQKLPEPTDKDWPLTLLTGRGSSSMWHTQTRTAKSPVLRKLAASTPYVEISPVDANELGIAQSDWVVVESRRGSMHARAFVTHVVQPKHVFVPMHYARANQLTFAAFDPHSRQPAYKACAVRVRKLRDGERVAP